MTDDRLTLHLAGDLAGGIGDDRVPAEYRTLFADPESYRAALHEGPASRGTPRGVTGSFPGEGVPSLFAVPEPRPRGHTPPRADKDHDSGRG